MKKKPAPAPAITTREDLEERMGDYARATIERDRQTAMMNKTITGIRERFEAVFATLDESAAAALADLEAWAALNPEDFGARRSIELLHGTIGYRTGQPALKTIKGVRWADVLARLKALRPDFVRTKEEPDKEALLAARGDLGADGLRSLGCKVEQTERFYAEPRLDEPDVATA